MYVRLLSYCSQKRSLKIALNPCTYKATSFCSSFRFAPGLGAGWTAMHSEWKMPPAVASSSSPVQSGSRSPYAVESFASPSTSDFVCMDDEIFRNCLTATIPPKYRAYILRFAEGYMITPAGEPSHLYRSDMVPLHIFRTRRTI